MEELDSSKTGVFVFQCVIIVFGTIGNVISFIVWTFGKRCRLLPVSTYLRFLAIADTFILTIPGVELLLVLPPAKLVLRNQSLFLCKSLVLITTSSLRISSWTLVILSVEKALRISLPLRMQVSNCGIKWRTPVELCMVLIVSVSMNIPNTVNSVIVYYKFSKDAVTNVSFINNETHALSFGSELDNEIPFTESGPLSNSSMASWKTGMSSNSTTVTVPTTRSTEEMLKCLSNCTQTRRNKKITFIYQYCNYLPSTSEIFMDMTLLFFVPFSVFLVCNACILCQLYRRSGVIMGIHTEQQYKRKLDFRNMTCHVVGLCVVHTVSTAPWYIFSLYRHYNVDADVFKHYQALYLMSNAFAYLNSAANVVLYCMLGVGFRKDFRQLFCAGRRCDVALNRKLTSTQGSSTFSETTSTTNSTRL